ncbi:MAG: ATP-dependent helicase [Anaerolineae bacterium]|nr:ATP-dependent helicase [Anaerolineae bacterium]
MAFKPRIGQADVVDYRGGKLAVAAVPGSGKTRTLSYLAARLVAEGDLREDQEVLVVTMSNSAADHFARQVGLFVREEFGLLAGVGYRVRTLHGLANDIVRMRPELLGLGEAFDILDDADGERLLADSVRGWVKASPGWYYELDQNPDTAQSRGNAWLDLLTKAAGAFIKKAKDERWTPEQVSRQLKATSEPMVLARACADIYQAYQDLLTYRGAVDFADLIGGGLTVLQRDKELLAQLQARWPYVLEDEAQDSSLAQENLLRLLTAQSGNWVRVGDPNQAIYETFTTASPEHLRRFMREDGVSVTELPYSGRSAPGIIALANRLSGWSREHPHPEVQALQPLSPPDILPTPPDDPQPNPADSPNVVRLIPQPSSSDEERKRIAEHIRRTLDAGSPMTMAVLVPRNNSGAEMAKALQAVDVPFRELLRTPSSARRTAHVLAAVVDYLAHPMDVGRLERAMEAWAGAVLPDAAVIQPELSRVFAGVKRMAGPEGILFSDEATIAELIEVGARGEAVTIEAFWAFRRAMVRWLRASVLPVDQLILTIGQETFNQPFDLAVVHSVAIGLRRVADRETTWRLKQFAGELERIAENRRSVYGLSDDIEGGEEADPAGQVTISTMHRAKGLEWDRVYLTSVNNYDFPSAEPQDSYLGEREFVRGGLNIEQEVIAQLRAVMDPLNREYEEGEATVRARFDYVAERLRLLYVGLTRARRELFVTTNDGQGQARPAVPLLVLDSFWREQDGDTAQ